ncbi:MAG TPA: hypothetical protein VJB82_05055 [Candidatus Peribacterales bacterium]|nr:hypothetical protein [Candidatus Peribacterales bacterium]
MTRYTRIIVGISLFLLGLTNTIIAYAATVEVNAPPTRMECENMLSPAAFAAQEQYEDALWYRQNPVHPHIYSWLQAHSAFQSAQNKERIKHSQQIIACDNRMKMREKEIEISTMEVHAFRPNKSTLGELLPVFLVVTGGEIHPVAKLRGTTRTIHDEVIWRDMDVAFRRLTRRSLIQKTEVQKRERLFFLSR